MTTNINAARVAELLHRSRTPDFSLDDIHALSRAITATSEIEAKLALIYFIEGAMSSARSVLMLQRDAALLAETMAERDATSGPLQ